MTTDLRSDTLTKPSAAMRRAMAEADVGDDVFGEDPTLNALEARCAALSGKEAALFVPSGTMANAIASRIHTQPGDEVILERTSHLYRYEAGGFAALSGLSVALLEGQRGLLRPAQVAPAIRGADIHEPRGKLLWLENTHNYGGGTCYSLADLKALRLAALAEHLSVHIDGARIWNATVKEGYSLAEAAQQCETMSFCFSKGLGCPVGSALVGSREHIKAARRVRKLFGGGMRQAGVLAAAALYALEHNVDRLAEDHRRTQALAAALGEIPGLEVEPADTNILFVGVANHRLPAEAIVHQLAEADVKVMALSPTRIRLVTHLDVDDAGIDRAISAFRALKS